MSIVDLNDKEEEEEEEELEIVEEEVNDKEEYATISVNPNEAKRLQKMQEEFIATSKKVQIADYQFVYKKQK